MGALAFLLLTTTLVYWPALQADFVRWDDHTYVQENKRLKDAAGLRELWDPRTLALEQYYPLLFTSYWLEYRLWGLDPRGYHATNVCLHLVNVSLVLLLMLRLGASRGVAFAVAAVFALHPVQVASVAWITERKNTLSALFYLASFLLYLRYRLRGASWAYGLCLTSFAAGLLVKTQIVTLPLSLCLADVLLQRLGRIPRLPLQSLGWRLAPLLGVALLAAGVTGHFEQKPWTPTLTLAERILIAANAAWFYPGAFLVPLWPTPIHPRWQLETNDVRWWVAPFAWLPAIALLVYFRRCLREFTLWGIAHFYLVLLPVLGFLAFNYMTYSFVSDHFLYLSVIGGGLAVAAEGERLIAGRAPASRWLVASVAGLLLAACAVRSHSEARYWRNNETFWTHVREHAPQDFLANYNLGNHYARQANWAPAAQFYLQASDARPRVWYPFRAYAQALVKASGPHAVVDACNAKLDRTPNFSPAYLERGIAEEELGRLVEASADYGRVMRLEKPDSEIWKRARYRRNALRERRDSERAPSNQ